MPLKKEKKSKKGCPDDEVFVGAFLNEITDEAKENLLDHALACRKCATKFEALRQLKNEVSEKVLGFSGRGLSREEEKQLRKLARAKVKELKKSQEKYAFGLFPLKKLALASGILLFIALIAWFWSLPRGDIYRNTERNGVKLIGPHGKLSTSPSIFSWKAAPEAEYFEFELIDEELRILYHVSQQASTFTLPEKVKENLARGKRYLWRVEAFDDEHRLLGSAVSHFEIK